MGLCALVCQDLPHFSSSTCNCSVIACPGKLRPFCSTPAIISEEMRRKQSTWPECQSYPHNWRFPLNVCVIMSTTCCIQEFIGQIQVIRIVYTVYRFTLCITSPMVSFRKTNRSLWNCQSTGSKFFIYYFHSAWMLIYNYSYLQQMWFITVTVFNTAHKIQQYNLL